MGFEPKPPTPEEMAKMQKIAANPEPQMAERGPENYEKKDEAFAEGMSDIFKAMEILRKVKINEQTLDANGIAELIVLLNDAQNKMTVGREYKGSDRTELIYRANERSKISSGENRDYQEDANLALGQHREHMMRVEEQIPTRTERN